MTVLETVNLTHLYSPGTLSETAAIKNVNLKIDDGEFLGIIGHTGSGKSTLISHLNGLLKPSSGSVLFRGGDIWESKQSVRAARFAVGLCFQYPEYQLFEETVYKDIAFGPRNMGLSEDEIDMRVQKAARFVGLRPDILKKSPFDLSGGEKRRAAIAGVMAMEPSVLVLDEPTVGLDPRGGETVLGLIRDYRSETGRTVVIVSHSMENIARLAGRVIVLNKGEIYMSGTVDEVYSHGGELARVGLSVPEVTRIFAGLKARGLPVSTSVYTVEQGRAEFLRLMGKGGGAK